MRLVTQEARKQIEDLNKSLSQTASLVDEISKSKGPRLDGGDIDKALSSVLKNIQEMGKASAGMKQDQRNPNARNSQGERISNTDLELQSKEFERQMTKVNQVLAKQINSMEQLSEVQARKAVSRSRIAGGPSTGRDYPEETELDIRRTQRDRQRVTSRATSSITGLQTAARTGRRTHGQAETLRGHLEGVYYDSTGASPEHYEDVRKFAKGEGDITWQPTAGSPLDRAQRGIRSSTDRIQDLQEERTGIREQLTLGESGEVTHTKEALDNLILADKEVTEEIKNQQRLREENRKLLTEIVDAIRSVDASVEKFEADTAEKGVTVDPKKGSPADVIASRSSAIALSAMTAGIYALNKTMQQGREIVERERPTSMNIGNRTGNYDFRQIRRDARESGEFLGYSGADMLDFQDVVMGSLGYTDETLGVTDELARGERFLGAGEDNLTALFDSVLRSGGMSTSEESRNLVDQIKGGIISSGMVGREEEQVTAMQALLDETIAGRKATSEEIESQMAMMNLFAGTGNEALQGQNLERNIGSLIEGIQSSDMFSDFGYFMGVGTDAYFAGPEGAFRHQQELEKGLDSDYVLDAINNMVGMYGEDYVKSMMVGHEVFSGMSTDAIGEIVSQSTSGQLTRENANKIAERDREAGAEALGEASGAWAESPDQLALETANKKEQRQANTSDSALGDIGMGISNKWESLGASSPGASIATTLLGAVGQGLVTGVTSSFLLGTGSTLLKGVGQEGLSSIGSMISGGSTTVGGGGIMSGIGSAISSGASFLGNMTESQAMTGLKGGGLIGSALKIGTGAYQVATAERKGAEAVSQTGNVGGGIAGGLAGGKAGAAIGTMIMPGIGTAIGGAIGGIGGSIAGSGIGKGIGDWVAGKFFGGTDEQHAKGTYDESKSGIVTRVKASEEGEQADLAISQQDVATTTAKGDIESLRKENIHNESENLSSWDLLLVEIKEVLAIARKQNGIIGQGGLGNSVSTGGTGVGGELGAVKSGAYWTSSDLKNHDLGKTTSTLTSDQLDAWISSKAPKGSEMIGMGSAFMEAGKQSGLDPRYLVAHAAHETAWGTTNYAKAGNFFGIGAFDSNPDNAYNYGHDSAREGIIGGANWIAENYYARGETTLNKMSERYATDPGWAQKIANTMVGSESHTSRSTGDINISTTVNMKSTGNDKRDGEKIAGYVGPSISSLYLKEYRPI